MISANNGVEMLSFREKYQLIRGRTLLQTGRTGAMMRAPTNEFCHAMEGRNLLRPPRANGKDRRLREDKGGKPAPRGGGHGLVAESVRLKEAGSS